MGVGVKYRERMGRDLEVPSYSYREKRFSLVYVGEQQ